MSTILFTRRLSMTIDLNEDKKRAEIWLSRKEASDSQTELNRLISQYKKMNYLVIVFYSGERDISEMTGMLLKNNIV